LRHFRSPVPCVTNPDLGFREPTLAPVQLQHFAGLLLLRSSRTAASGEIDVLVPAGYVTMTITISIVNDVVGAAAIGTSSGNGVTINASAGNSVHLRGPTIAGFWSGANGILFTAGGNLEI
jgi:hypothetical protein